MHNSFKESFEKKAGAIANTIKNVAKSEHFGHGAELAGLGALAAYPIHGLIKGPKKDKPREAMETAGLGILAAPSVAHFGKALLTKKAFLGFGKKRYTEQIKKDHPLVSTYDGKDYDEHGYGEPFIHQDNLGPWLKKNHPEKFNNIQNSKEKDKYKLVSDEAKRMLAKKYNKKYQNICVYS